MLEVDRENQKDESVQRWTAKRRSALVMSIIKGETSVQEAARKHGLTVAEIESWKERFLFAAENALRSRPRDEEALKDEEIKKLQHRIVSKWIQWYNEHWPHMALGYLSPMAFRAQQLRKVA